MGIENIDQRMEDLNQKMEKVGQLLESARHKMNKGDWNIDTEIKEVDVLKAVIDHEIIDIGFELGTPPELLRKALTG